MKTLRKLIDKLGKEKLTLACAESASGGYVSYLLTKIPGSSRIFRGSIVVYSLEAKTKFFKIPPAILRQTQGVSRKITSLLARRVKNILNTDVGAALTGFAGPAGKNVGQVFLSVSYRNKTSVKKVMIKGSRDKVRKEASMILIEMIYNQVGAGHARPVKK